MTRRLTYPLKAIALSALALTVASCEDEDNENKQGNWYNTYQYFPGTPRAGAVCFQIEVDGTLCAFVGTGANTNKTEENERFRDFYMAKPGDDGLPVWTARYERLYADEEDAIAHGGSTANIKFYKDNATYDQAVASWDSTWAAVNGAVAFTLNGKGYVGLGYDGSQFHKEFYCYDPSTNSWSKSVDYPGDAVRYATAFVIDNVAYVGGGEDYDNNILGDFYSFDGTSWNSIASIGTPRAQATSFVVNGKGYVFGGINGSVVTSFQRYNPESNSWETLRWLSDRSRSSYDDQYGSLAMYGSTSFVLNDETANVRAYVATGSSTGTGQGCWEYNPIYDYWIEKTAFEGAARKFAVSFVLEADTDGKGIQQAPFLATGGTSDLTVTGSSGSFYSDCWLFEPQSPYESRD